MVMHEKILVIEDEQNIRKIIVDYFKQAGYEVVEAQDGKAGLAIFERSSIDLVVLDVMMPELDGWTVCRRIRKHSQVPIIMLTARTDEDDELMGFELKADDYVKKPFSPAVLIARAKLLLSKKRVEDTTEAREKYGLTIDQASRQVTLEGNPIELTTKEFDILTYLFEHENRVFSRDQILSQVWGYDFVGDTRIVDNHIKKIRRALGEKSYYIRTVFGVGYKFEVKD
jgi:DNA-binding response OmpR family regulator